MNTDVSSGSVSAELEKAAELLKSNGLPHAAAALLAPEGSKTEKPERKTEVAAAPKRGRAAAKALAEASKVKKAAKAKAAKAASKKVTQTKKVKAAAAKAEKQKATSGQSGPAIEELPWNALNKKEKLLVGAFDLEGDREVRTIEQLAEQVFKGKAKNLKQANSWTRNSLRRLMRSGKWLEKTEPGKYRLTVGARKLLSAKD